LPDCFFKNCNYRGAILKVADGKYNFFNICLIRDMGKYKRVLFAASFPLLLLLIVFSMLKRPGAENI